MTVRRFRSWALRLVVLGVATSVLAGVAVAVDVARDRSHATIELTRVAAAGEPSSTLATDGASSYHGSTGLVSVLVIGSDERAGLGGARADALHVISLNQQLGQATMLNIPRDTWVEVPGQGNHKINEAYSLGGAQLQADTITGLTGIRIDYVLTTTFDGVIAMVDEMGGLSVDVPTSMRDSNSGANFAAGVQTMTGEQVLSLSRNRNLSGGDLTRTTNQGIIILSALSHLRAKGTDAFATIGYLDVLLRHVRTDVGVADLYRLGRAGLAVDPAQLRNMTMPARLGTVGSASVVFPTDDAAGVFADMADDGVLQQH